MGHQVVVVVYGIVYLLQSRLFMGYSKFFLEVQYISDIRKKSIINNQE